MCKKNKIDVVKAVCSSAVKKLAVLSLAVAVSSGAVANAQMSGKDAKKQLSEMSPLERLIMKTGDKSKWQMYTELSRKIEEKFEEIRKIEAQANEKERQADEKKRQVGEKERQAAERRRKAEKKDRQAEEKDRQAEEKERQAELGVNECLVEAYSLKNEACWLYNEAYTLKQEEEVLNREIVALLQDVNQLEDEVIAFHHELGRLRDELRGLLEQINPLGDELIGGITEEQRSQAELVAVAEYMANSQHRPVEEVAPEFFSNIGLPRETAQRIMSLFGYENQQQNQRQQYFGGSFNPFNWGLFGGGKK